MFGRLPGGPGGAMSCVVRDTVNAKRPVMMLEASDGAAVAALRPELAERVGIRDADVTTADRLRERLTRAGVALHDPDLLYYLPADTPPEGSGTVVVRPLAGDDRVAFDVFAAAASGQDREDASVELDHWLAIGGFDGERLVSVASMYLWDGSPFADIGVLTLLDARGRGYAGAVVRSIMIASWRQGYEPQYRCQEGNRASAALARSCGMNLFGRWTVTADAP